jgi:hypothetical protein
MLASVDVVMTGRPDLVEMAVDRGYFAGARLDKVPEHEGYGTNLEMIDIHWKNPRPDALVSACRRHRPTYCVAGDYDGENHGTINDRARRLRGYCENVIVVPHHDGDLAHVPEWAVIGYSVPSEYAATEIPLRRYREAEQPIHILGGTPHDQLGLLGQLWTDNVVSMDCNSHHKAATIGSKAWHPTRPRWRQVPEGPDRVERAYETSVKHLDTEYQQRGIA